ncbi:MAG: hypothetical protein P4L40_02635 [Terracidiphilus sp.]|nr:hypothetical protein [Terracidiphilus sp.]
MQRWAAFMLTSATKAVGMEPFASAIAQKEREVQQYSALRINTLEASAMERVRRWLDLSSRGRNQFDCFCWQDRVLDAERARYLKLKEDFQYNLVVREGMGRAQPLLQSYKPP